MSHNVCKTPQLGGRETDLTGGMASDLEGQQQELAKPKQRQEATNRASVSTGLHVAQQTCRWSPHRRRADRKICEEILSQVGYKL